MLSGVSEPFRVRPRELLAGAAVALVETVAAVLALWAASLVSTGLPMPARVAVAGGATLGLPFLLRPLPLALLYAACRGDLRLRAVPSLLRADSPRLLAAGVVAHLGALAFLPVGVLLAAGAIAAGVSGFFAVGGGVSPFAVHPVPETALQAAGIAAIGLGYALAVVPVSFADLRTLDGVPARGAGGESVAAAVVRPRAVGPYLLGRCVVTLLAAGTTTLVVFGALGGLGQLSSLPARVVAVLVGAVVLSFLRTVVARAHVRTYERAVAPAVAGGVETARPRRVVAAVAVVGVLAVTLVTAAGATAYGTPVESDYTAPETFEPPTETYTYVGTLTVEDPDGTVTGRLELRQRAGANWTVADIRQTGFETAFDEVRASDGPLVYRVVTTPDRERFEYSAAGGDRTSWRYAHNATRTVYVQEWGEVRYPREVMGMVVEGLAYRRAGTTTYRGLDAVRYEAKSWLLPRETRRLPADGELLVAAETGAVLRLDATVERDDRRVSYEFAYRPSAHGVADAGRDVERRVRRNVTVDSPIYPDDTVPPGVTASRSGRVVGAAFRLDGDGVTVPAGATVTAVGANGTNYTTTLTESVTPGSDGVPVVFDLAFAVREDGTLDRRRVSDLDSVPESDGPPLDRLVVRDPASGVTYVDANVSVSPLRGADLSPGTTGDGHRYVQVAATPERAPFHYELVDAETGEVVESDTVSVRRFGYLYWRSHEWSTLAFQVPTDDDIEAANGAVERRYVVRVFGPRGLVAERTVTLSRPRATATPASLARA